jgi:hypothetical protein
MLKRRYFTLKRLLSLAMAAVLAVGLCACSNAQPEEPVDTPGVTEPEIMNEAPGQPVAAVTPEPKTEEQKEMEAIESLLPGKSFRDMNASELSVLTDQLGSDFKVFGRTDGAGNAYALIRLSDGKPFVFRDYALSGDPEYRYICFEISHADGLRTLEVAKVIKEGSVEREEVLYSVRDIDAIDFGDEFGYVLLNCEDEKVRNAVLPGSRAVMIEAAARGLESIKPEGACVSLMFYDAQIRDNLGFGEPVCFYLPLNDEQYKKAEELIGAGFTPKDAKELQKKFPDLYDTGVTLFIDGESYSMFSCDAFRLGSAEGYYPTLLSEDLSNWLRIVAKPYLGHDPAAYRSGWFDMPLASAALTFHVRTEVDGYMVIKEQVQTIADPERLQKLSELFRDAEYGSVSACAYGAELTITRKDGETLTVFVAEDSCGTALIQGSIWCDYGKQDKLAEIFDEAMDGRM